MIRHITLTLLAVVSIAGSWLISWYLYSTETEQISFQFEREVGKRVDALEQELVKHRATLRHWKSFFEAAESMDSQAFKLIADDVLRIYPSLQMMAWSPVVPQAQKAEFEREMRQRWSQFQIYDINSDLVNAVVSGDKASMQKAMDRIKQGNVLDVSEQRSVYFPFSMIEPIDSKGYLLGVDLTSVNKLTFDMQMILSSQANDVAGMPVIPSPFTPEHEPIFMAVVPVFKSGPNVTPNTELKGFLTATIEIESLVLLSSLNDASDINFMLVDETGDHGLKQLYQLGQVDLEHDNLEARPVLPVFGRQWVVKASPKAGYAEARRSGLPWIVAVAGTLLSGFVILYMVLLLRQNNVVRQLVEKRTRELREANKSLNDMNKQLEEMSRTDGLTQVANRRYFNETLSNEWRKAMRQGKPLAVILMDVDFFKRYNDHYGHLAGDECLQKVAAALKGTFTRAGDLVARYGGEEFAVILPNTGGDAAQVAERAREAIASVNLPHEKSDAADYVSVSIGVTSVIPSEGIEPTELVDCADQGLYLAKENGRNRVIYHTFHSQNESMEMELDAGL